MAARSGYTISRGGARGFSNGKLPDKGATSNNGQQGNGHRFLILKNKLTALVVDGDNTSRIVSKALLDSYGVETRAVDNGLQAVNLFAAGETFDLTVIDMQLPLVNGLEATRRIRAMGIHSKILGIASFGFERERQAFLAAGADDFMGKPLTTERLVPILLELDNL